MRQGSTHVSIRANLPAFVSLAFLAAIARPAEADEPAYPASRLGFRTAPLLLLSRPDVRADLALDATQAASVERTINELWIRAASLRGRQGPEVVAARRAIDEAQRGWIETQLTDGQRGRLVQVDLQWEGPSALVSRALVAEGLGLTPEQRGAIEAAVVERDRGRVEGRARPEDERLLARKALDILTPDQQGRWKAMLGPPFVPRVAAAASPGNAPRR